MRLRLLLPLVRLRRLEQGRHVIWAHQNALERELKIHGLEGFTRFLLPKSIFIGRKVRPVVF
jgi:hypothetical protein